MSASTAAQICADDGHRQPDNPCGPALQATALPKYVVHEWFASAAVGTHHYDNPKSQSALLPCLITEASGK